jgi:hypothetical protein
MNTRQTQSSLMCQGYVGRFLRIATILVITLILLPLRVLVFGSGPVDSMLALGLHYGEGWIVVSLMVVGQAIRYLLSQRNLCLWASFVSLISSLVVVFPLLYLVTSTGTIIPVFNLPPVADYEPLGVFSALILVPILGLGGILLVSTIGLFDALRNRERQWNR